MSNVKIGDKVIVRLGRQYRVMFVLNDHYNDDRYMVVVNNAQSYIVAKLEVVAIVEQLGV